jgi:hypothetical protein
MDHPHYFADVDLPFHVWVREGRRWVLRDTRLQRDASVPSRGAVEREHGKRERSKPGG